MNHYVYALLDPRKPTTNSEFSHEPFYIGKGSGDRYKDFSTRTKWCKNIIGKLKSIDMKPISVIIEGDLTSEDAYDQEEKWIAQIGRKNINTGTLVNTDKGGGAITEHTEATKDLIRKANTGRTFTKEHRKKLSDGMMGSKNPMYGKVGANKDKVFSEESRKRMSDAAKKRKTHPWTGRKHSEKSKALISESRKGKLTGENNHQFGKGPMLGKTHSEETKNKQSLAMQKTRYRITFPDGTIINSTNLREFCKGHMLDQGNMSRVANGKYKSHKGFKVTKMETK